MMFWCSNTGCLLTIILLMRALDPLGYEKETLAHFQTLKVSTDHAESRTRTRRVTDWTLSYLPQEVDSMRCAYYSDLCSKFMIENTILKMEYAEVRVFSISDKVDSKSDHRFYFHCYGKVLKSNFSFFFFFLLTETDHLMPPGSAIIGNPYQSVL